MIRLCFVLVALPACATPPPPAAELGPETDRSANVSTAEWALADGHRLNLDGDGLWLTGPGGAQQLAAEAVDLPAVNPAGDRVVFAARPQDLPETDLRVAHYHGGAWTVALLAEGGADRPAISDDGEHVAFARPSAEGIAALWVLDLDCSARDGVCIGGEALQLTNRDLVHASGAAPLGFVPLPHRTAPWFDGDQLVWLSPQGEHRTGVIR